MNRAELAQEMANAAQSVDSVKRASAWVNGDTISVEVEMRDDRKP